ncbi:MAG TPA: hypothetical protein VHE60_03170 [Pyrinomonadaceae bacterium]|nr:hypothetical protein [Pyrinomonadaceae bacterium]
MRRVLIVVVLIVAAAVLGLWRTHGARGLSEAMGMSRNDPQGEARDEVHKSFQLEPGARLEVQGINGAVDIQTSDTKTVEVYVLRTANSKDALARREVIIEQTVNGLLVRCEQSRKLGFWERLWGHNPNEQISIKAPRQIALSLKDVNGRVTTGDIDGPLEAKGINGRVQLGQTSGSAEISGINGGISVGLRQLGERGARLSSVNGNIELRLTNDLNADLVARGMNGRLSSEIPAVTVDSDEHGSRYSAHIGNGGAPITISGINGNVRLTAAESATSSASSDKKPGVANEKSEKSAADSKSAKREQ